MNKTLFIFLAFMILIGCTSNTEKSVEEIGVENEIYYVEEENFIQFITNIENHLDHDIDIYVKYKIHDERLAESIGTSEFFIGEAILGMKQSHTIERGDSQFVGQAMNLTSSLSKDQLANIIEVDDAVEVEFHTAEGMIGTFSQFQFIVVQE